MQLAVLLRAHTRATAIVLWIALMFSLRMLATPLRPWLPGWDRRWRSMLFRVWGRVALRIMGIRLTVRGRPPRAPFFLVSNHFAMADVVVLSAMAGPAFVAKAELSGWPFVGAMSRWMGVIFINRERRSDALRVNAAVLDAIARGEGVHVFPEGRVAAGGEVLPFKPALFEAPASTGLPVHYAAIRYQTPPGSPKARDAVVWHAGQTFVEHFFNLVRLPHLDCTLTFGDAPLTAPDRKTLAHTLHAAVKERAAHLTDPRFIGRRQEERLGGTLTAAARKVENRHCGVKTAAKGGSMHGGRQ